MAASDGWVDVVTGHWYVYYGGVVRVCSSCVMWSCGVCTCVGAVVWCVRVVRACVTRGACGDMVIVLRSSSVRAAGVVRVVRRRGICVVRA